MEALCKVFKVKKLHWLYVIVGSLSLVGIILFSLKMESVNTVSSKGYQNSDLQTKDITKGDPYTKTFIGRRADEATVIQVMHEMTHQKVKAKEKWGAVQMTQDHIDHIYAIVKASHFKHRTHLLSIAARWKQGDFRQIVKDHNYFWKLEKGNIGKAYGILSPEDEKAFINHNFK